MITSETQDKLFQELNHDTTILTPNRRLSATLHKYYIDYQIKQSHQCWQTPDILPVTSWVERLWSENSLKDFSSSPLLLNTAQEQFLWEKVIAAAKESGQLLQVSETADIAKSAWGLLKQWQVGIDHPIFNSAEDYIALRNWANDFQVICTDNNWTDAASLPDIVIEKIKESAIIPSQHIILIGFTEISPQLKQLLSSCEARGTKVTHLASSQSISDCKRISLADSEQEVLSIARWAKTLYEKDKSVKIGCVIPSLDKMRDRVQQIFAEVFAAENTYTVNIQQCPFNISAGRSLLQYPIINTALQLLNLWKKTISTEAFSYLLASPFLGDAETERVQRYKFDRFLRTSNFIEVDLTNAKKFSSLSSQCSHLAKRIQQFFSLITENNRTLSYSDWSELFVTLLTLLGWPGERSLSSEEYQIVENWLKLLSEYKKLDQIAQPVTMQYALQNLQRMAGKTFFQPKTPEAPIQVLGILEAAGLPFDYLWVAGMDDLSWPPQPKPNPFIPKQLQRELHMPHATAERELFFCQTITNQFKQSAKHIIFSHALKNEALELQASPLIRDLAEIYLDDLYLGSYQAPSERIFLSKKTETLCDNTGPPLIHADKIRGGVSVIKQQAACPFKAFSEWRLHAQELESPLPGLRAKDRGTIIHKILELIWNRLGDQTSLKALQDEKLNELIDQCVSTALSSLINAHSEASQYISLEKQRLTKVMRNWLEIEKARPAFKVISNEKNTQINLSRLNLTVKVDRIDELEDGKKLIIDYKTGKNNDINSWFSDRPEEPQLLLYSLLESENLAGITFAQLSPGENGFKGVSRHATEINGVKPISEVRKAAALSWEEQVKQWNITLTKLSDDFYQGVATVDPKDAGQTCAWCALKSLCRVNEDALCHSRAGGNP